MPSKTKTPITPAQIQKIKILQRSLGMDDADYRAMLQNVGGVDSCKDLAGAKIGRVMDHLERCAGQQGVGKRDKGRGKRGRKLPARNSKIGTVPEPMATQEQLDKIWALWQEVSVAPPDKRGAALDFFLLKRFGVHNRRWLTLETAVKVIEGLKKMEARQCSGK